MIISRKLSGLLPPSPIVLEKHEIERVQEFTYLGILLSSNLSWSKHIINKCNKARRLLGLIFRRFGSACSRETLRKLYISYVRPHLEYAASLWDPHIQSDISRIESVQRFACRICMKWKHASYEDMLIELELPSLRSRRNYLKLCTFLKLCTGYYVYPNLCLSTTRSTSTRSSNFSLSIPLCRANYYLYSFFPNSMKLWNNLLKCFRSISFDSSFSLFKHYLLQWMYVTH